MSLSCKDGLGLQFRTIALQLIHHVHHLKLKRNQIHESQTGTSNLKMLLWELMDSLGEALKTLRGTLLKRDINLYNPIWIKPEGRLSLLQFFLTYKTCNIFLYPNCFNW